MKVAIVNSIRVCGGGEKWLERQSTRWRERGYEPVVLCQPGSELESLVRSRQLPYRAVPMPHDLAVKASARIAGILREERPDVLLCCNARAYRLAVPASRIAGRPTVLYRNGLLGTFKNQAFNRWLFRWTAGMVVNAAALRDEMSSYGWIPKRKLRIIENGVDAPRFRDDPAARARVRAEVGTSPNTVVAAIVARIADDKGQQEAITAMAELARAHPHTELWVVGEGGRRAELTAHAQSMGLGDRIRFLGFRSDIPAVLQAIDIVVQASHREGLGNALLEAMAAGRPVVATAVGGTPQLVRAEITGDLVPPHDIPALAGMLGRLFREPERRQQYGQAGRRRVEEAYSLEGETDQWCHLFEELRAERERR